MLKKLCIDLFYVMEVRSSARQTLVDPGTRSMLLRMCGTRLDSQLNPIKITVMDSKNDYSAVYICYTES